MENVRVTAIESFKNGIMRSYGEGVLIKDQVPDFEPFKTIGLKNPCIKLDSGKYIWGFQCWWGETKRFMKTYEGNVHEIIIVDVKDEILPLVQ